MSTFKEKVNSSRIGRLVTNKYFIFFVIVFLYVLFFNKNSVINYFHTRQDNKIIEREKENYIKMIEETDAKINELVTNKESLEKFARENYQFIEEGEDLYIIKENE